MAEKTRKPSYWIHTAISLSFMFLFGFIPPAFGLTEIGMALVGILFGTVYGWITLEIAWPSMAGLLAIAVWGCDSITGVMRTGFGNNTVVMMLFMLVFTMYMDRCGVMDSFSKWFISRKVIVGRPYVVILIFYALSAILSLATSNIPALLFMFTVITSFCKKLGFEKGSKYPNVLVFSSFLGSQFGLGALMIKPVQLMTVALIESATGESVDALVWFLYYTGRSAVVLAIWLLGVRFAIRPEVDLFKNMTEDDYAEYRNMKFPKETKIGLSALAFMIFVMFEPQFFPKDWALTKFCNNAGTIGAVLLTMIILAIFPKDKAKLNFNAVANSGKMGWNLILMTAFALTVASGLSGDSSGFNEAITTNLVPMLSALSPSVVIIAFCTILHVLTSVLNNSAMMAIFINPMAAVASGLGLNAFFTIMTGVTAIGDAILTPAGTAAAALLMGNEWMDMKQYYKHAVITFIAYQILIIGSAFILF